MSNILVQFFESTVCVLKTSNNRFIISIIKQNLNILIRPNFQCIFIGVNPTNGVATNCSLRKGYGMWFLFSETSVAQGPNTQNAAKNNRNII